MKLEYDNEGDAAYIYIEYPVKDNAVKRTIAFNDDIILDFDEKDKLLGVEILNASRHLSKNVLIATV